MNTQTPIMLEAQKAKQTKNIFMRYTKEDRNNALKAIAQSLNSNKELIEETNQRDIDRALELKLSSALIDRLKLNQERVTAIANSVAEIVSQPEVVGAITESNTREDGLKIEKQRIPIGVIGMIFESRPNVVVDCSALAIKSGNCIILKGGKEAQETNALLGRIIREAIKEFIPEDVVQLIQTRDDVSKLLSQVDFIDVILPRGGEGLIKHVCENSKVPVLAHYKGLCHIFIDQVADQKTAIQIALNAKASRPGVCNAMETLLIHQDFNQAAVLDLLDQFHAKETELRVCEKLLSKFQAQAPYLKAATDADWDTEYLDNILSIKEVENMDAAIEHINQFGSHHTEAIISTSSENQIIFQNSVDASSIMINASTRFNDGGEYGLGAELGISTSKLHAYGPMGAKEMTTERFVVTGAGHTR